MSKRSVLLIFALIALALAVTACNASSSTASCAYVVGNGVDGNDTKVSTIIYPGQKIIYNSADQNVWYVPCNSRNYIVNDGTILNANGTKVGDRFVLLTATTKTGVPITIAASAFWTLNQSDRSMKDFYTFCFKYTCASADDKGGGANFSTEGWNGMLGENFGPVMSQAAKSAAIIVDDAIWQKPTPKLYQDLGDAMSLVFADMIRARLGFPEDIFCGSGNSRWSDENRPGAEGNTFTCQPVRIVVDDVKRGDIQASDNTEGALAISAQRLENAKALYGPDAGYWLGLQDTVTLCRNSEVTCVFNVGDVPNSAVAVPVNKPTPTAMPTPTEKPK